MVSTTKQNTRNLLMLNPSHVKLPQRFSYRCYDLLYTEVSSGYGKGFEKDHPEKFISLLFSFEFNGEPISLMSVPLQLLEKAA